MESILRLVGGMLAHLVLAIAPMVTPVTAPTPHTLTAMASVEVWAQGLGDLRGIAVDVEGHVWVTDHAGGRVLRLDGPGAGQIVASGLQGPMGIALDRAGRVLVAEEQTGRILHVDPHGALSVIASGLDRPRWLAVAEDDTIYVSARRSATSDEADESPRPGVVLALRAAEHPALVAHGLHHPEGLAVRDGILYVATRGHAHGHDDPILRIPLTGDGDERPSEHTAGALRKPVGLALDGAGALFVSARRLVLLDDHVAGVITRLDPAGTADVFAGGADHPEGLAFDRDGHLYLAERKAGRVVRFLAPRPPMVDALPSWTSTAGVTLSGHAEPEARVEVVWGEAISHLFAGPAGVFTLPLALVPDAVNRLAVRAIGHDGAGLASPSVALTVVHDAITPALAFDSPPTGATVRDSLIVRATATDGGSAVATLELLVDGQALASIASSALPAPSATASASWNPAGVGDGVHTLTARATDRAGNVGSLTRAVTVDTTPPQTEIDGPFDSRDGLRFTFNGSDNLTPAGELEFAWRLDGGAWSAFSPARATTPADLAPGLHQIEAKARDRAGNEDPSPASLAFSPSGGGLGVSIVEPSPGAVVPAGSLLVRGTLAGAGGDVAVTVNGALAWLDGTAFTALVDIDAGSTSVVATATAPDGRTGRASVAVTVSGEIATPLVASPWSGVAPLTVVFSLSPDARTVRVELDADGDGTVDVSGDRLERHVAIYPRPGVYAARATLIDAAGRGTSTSAVVRVFDRAALDAQLRAQWTAMRDALRRGDVAAGVGHIVARRRTDYDAAFRLLTASLPVIDSILTDLALVDVRNASAIYEMRRTDDGVLKSFEVRFAIDGDGAWRLEAF